MNIEDIISIDGKKLPVRVVLSLMELEADLKGASYWGTYLLYHAFDTNDKELREEVGQRLSAMGQPRYEGRDQKENQKSLKGLSGNNLTQGEIHFRLKLAIYELMELKDKEGKYLFEYQNHWIAIFWKVVELHIGIFEYQYDEFKNLIESLDLTDLRVKFVKTSINDCMHNGYRGFSSQWVCQSTSSRGQNAFARMKLIDEEFGKLLEKNGLAYS